MGPAALDWNALRRELRGDAHPANLEPALAGAARTLLAQSPHGDLARWLAASDALKGLAQAGARPGEEAAAELDSEVVRLGQGPNVRTAQVERALLDLSPWRKGPFEIAGVPIDAEWRSHLKWSRVEKALDLSAMDLRGRSVLDVGSGNGYYGYRALGRGARCVVGIDPSPQYVVQFEATRHFAPLAPVWVLPLRLEDLPSALSCFDVTLSMGVLYHRPSPFEHLRDLRLTLKPGGTLVLETLVIEGGPREVLVPEGRYAGMRNVFFLPSCGALESWLRRAGFEDVRVVDPTWTTPDEQRATAWSRGPSLADFLDAAEPRCTVEGEPAPLRAIVLARRPT